jgi:hypothetical protein
MKVQVQPCPLHFRFVMEQVFLGVYLVYPCWSLLNHCSIITYHHHLRCDIPYQTAHRWSLVIVIVIVYLFHRSLWLNSATGCRTCQKTLMHKQLIIQNSVTYIFIWLQISCIKMTIKLKKLNSMVWVRKRTIPTERPPLVGEVIANFADRGCHMVSMTDPYSRILRFLDTSRYFSIKQLLSCTHVAEWTSKNSVGSLKLGYNLQNVIQTTLKSWS